MVYLITTQRELRRRFWLEHPHLSRRKIPDYGGHGKMHCTDTRCAFADWLDAVSKNGEIPPELAERATL